MGLILAPIVAGKVDKWRVWADEIQNGKAGAFKAFNERYHLTRHQAYLAETPSGPVVAAIHEGPGAESFMQTLATSDHEFDVWFREKIKEFHGIDFEKPLPGPPPQLVINS